MTNIGAVLVILGVTLSSIEEAQSVPVPQSGQIPPLITFNDGKIGVNFLGFHAAAGLGGFLNGGGLHAEAGTPFGQKAVAGLGGALGRDGNAAGQLYAGATAGGNVRAAAGLGGAVIGGESPKTAGGLFSAASAGGLNSGSSLSGGVSDDVAYRVVEKTDTKPRNRKVVDDESTIALTKPADDGDANRVHVRGHPVRFNKFFGSVYTKTPSSQVNSQLAPRSPEKVISGNDELASAAATDDVVNSSHRVTDHKTVQKPIVATKHYTYETAPEASSAVSNSQSILNGFFGTYDSPKQVSSVSHVSANSGHKRTNTFFEDIFNVTPSDTTLNPHIDTECGEQIFEQHSTRRPFFENY